jgi:uncharacterized LabA/DUF88 family protein
MAPRLAVFVDGGFFLKRLKSHFPHIDPLDAREVATAIHTHSLRHINQAGGQNADLYRIFYYDCPPLTKKMHYPISRKSIDFSKTPIAIFRNSLRAELLYKRKVAVRMGHLLDAVQWRLKGDTLKELLNKKKEFSSLTDDDFEIDTIQKGVDMRLGLDVASLAYKKLADQIVLIIGDSDFVPAAKLARREGIDVILDPLGQMVHDSLNEHVDGVRTHHYRAKTEKPSEYNNQFWPDSHPGNEIIE